MAKKGPRTIVFACNAIINGKLVSEVFETENGAAEEATQLFVQKYSTEPVNVHGPFYRKRMGVLNVNEQIRLLGKNIVGIYRDWSVEGMVLSEPADHAYIMYKEHTSGKRMQKPLMGEIVKMSDIEVIKWI